MPSSANEQLPTVSSLHSYSFACLHQVIGQSFWSIWQVDRGPGSSTLSCLWRVGPGSQWKMTGEADITSSGLTQVLCHSSFNKNKRGFFFLFQRPAKYSFIGDKRVSLSTLLLPSDWLWQEDSSWLTFITPTQEMGFTSHNTLCIIEGCFFTRTQGFHCLLDTLWRMVDPSKHSMLM